MKKYKSDARQWCHACGTQLDDHFTFRVNRGGRLYCCNCYLRHNTKGEVNRPGQTQANVLHVMTPAGSRISGNRAAFPDPASPSENVQSSSPITDSDVSAPAQIPLSRNRSPRSSNYCCGLPAHHSLHGRMCLHLSRKPILGAIIG